MVRGLFYLGYFSSSKSFNHITKDASVFHKLMKPHLGFSSFLNQFLAMVLLVDPHMGENLKINFQPNFHPK
jgi:hypothetical protein